MAAIENRGRVMTSTARRVLTAPDGSFVLQLPRALHTLWAIHDSYPDARQTGVSIGGERVVLRFAPASRIQGVVADEAGKPLPDYELFVRQAAPQGSAGGGPGTARQIHEPRGAFSLDRLVAGAYSLEAVTVDGQRGETAVQVGGAETRTGVRLVVRRATTLVGLVVDGETGRPIEHADARLSSMRSFVETARSDAHGKFVVHGVPAGTAVGIMAWADGYETTNTRTEVPADLKEPTQVRLTLTRPKSVPAEPGPSKITP
jgi:hypothetical protein